MYTNPVLPLDGNVSYKSKYYSVWFGILQFFFFLVGSRKCSDGRLALPPDDPFYVSFFLHQMQMGHFISLNGHRCVTIYNYHPFSPSVVTNIYCRSLRTPHTELHILLLYLVTLILPVHSYICGSPRDFAHWLYLSKVSKNPRCDPFRPLDYDAHTAMLPECVHKRYFNTHQQSCPAAGIYGARFSYPVNPNPNPYQYTNGQLQILMETPSLMGPHTNVIRVW